MALASNLEATIGGWYKSVNLPRLPKNGQEWLADNVWWLALIGAIISVLGLLALIPLFLAAVALTAGMTMNYGYALSPNAYGGLNWLAALISIASYVATTVLLILAVSPLRVKAQRGWRLLFWSYLVNFVFAALSDVFSFNTFGIIGSLIVAVIAGYFLFEIRNEFVSVKTASKRAKAPTPSKNNPKSSSKK